MADDATVAIRTGGCGCCISSVAPSGSDLISAGISRQPLRALSRLAKHLPLGNIFYFEQHRAFSLKRRCCHGFSSVWNFDFAGHVVLVDCSVA